MLNTLPNVNQRFNSKAPMLKKSFMTSKKKYLQALQIFLLKVVDGYRWNYKFGNTHTVKYEPTYGKSYLPLPAKLSNTKSTINIMNYDNECSRSSVTRALNPVEQNAERLSTLLKEQSKSLNWEGLQYRSIWIE